MTTPHSEKLLQLAERCEAAVGPDGQLDKDIHEAVFRGPELPAEEIEKRVAAGENVFSGCLVWRGPLTASLDAAMTLVPEGWSVGDLGENWRAGGWRATLAERPTDGQRRAYDNGGTFMVESEHGEAATPALALCAAALRARAAQ